MKSKVLIHLIFGAYLLSSPAGFAADKKASMMHSATPEMRLKMADLHQKMADCLKSEKTMDECHQLMKQGCKETMGKDGCPMMGGSGHMGKRHDHKGMMPQQDAPENK